MIRDPTRMWSKRATQLRAYHIVVRDRGISKRGNGEEKHEEKKKRKKKEKFILLDINHL